MENSNDEIIQLAKEAEKNKKKAEKKQKNRARKREDSEIARANACESRVTVRRLDGATEMVIKPYPLTDNPNYALVVIFTWCVILGAVPGIIFVSSNTFSEWGPLAWLYKIFIVIAVVILIWIFFAFRYPKIHGTLGLRITDKDEEGKRYYILFRKDPVKPLQTGRYKGDKTNLKMNFYKNPAWGELKPSGYPTIEDLIPADQKKIRSFFKQCPFHGIDGIKV